MFHLKDDTSGGFYLMQKNKERIMSHIHITFGCKIAYGFS